MAVQLRRLMSLVSHMDVQLVAGENGLDKMVHWVHMVETVEACDFLDGNEIIFTTGIGFSAETPLLNLLKTVHENNVACLVVNLGPFISDVDAETIAYCNAHDFPLFTVPWRIHIAEMIRIFSFAITKSEQRELELSAAYKNAIFFPTQEALYMTTLLKYNLQIEWTYCAVIIKVQSDNTLSEERLSQLYSSMNNFLAYHYKNCTAILHKNRILLVFANLDESMLHLAIDKIRPFFQTMLQPTETACYGVGKCTKSIRCLYKSYAQALSVQKLQTKGKIDKDMIYYTEMGIYKLLISIEDTELLQDYYETTLQPLVKYDSEHNTDLATVLSHYLKYNGSVIKTANELYVHRNSINYKLQKISEILGMDLSTLHTRMLLEIGFMLQDML